MALFFVKRGVPLQMPNKVCLHLISILHCFHSVLVSSYIATLIFIYLYIEAFKMKWNEMK